MAKRERGAVAVDLGAGSGRYAAGWVEDGRLVFEVVHQASHAPYERGGQLFWKLDFLLGLCRQASEYAAANFHHATLGIDSWGVDHGFLGPDSVVLQDPVAYRDRSHLRAFDQLAPHRRRLYELTGIQHQPFNTVVQLLARREEHPDWPGRAEWMILPDLLGYLLTGVKNHEYTQASTTQLMGLDGLWSEEAFETCGWPVPDRQPKLPGEVLGRLDNGVELVSVGSHDTASAVFGLDGGPESAFLNVGSWSLFGAVLHEPIPTAEAESGGWSNERTVDGKVRLLKNIPGFYIVNRLHEELGLAQSVADWLAGADGGFEGRFDPFDPSLFSPDSMLEACLQLVDQAPANPAQWAAAALGSQVRATSAQPKLLEALTGRRLKSIRAGGGGSRSEAFRTRLQSEAGLPVMLGPTEATVVGNLALQLRTVGVPVDLSLQAAETLSGPRA